MHVRNRIRSTYLAAATLFATALGGMTSAGAAVIVDSGQDGTSTGNLVNTGKVIGFTLGSTAMTLDSVQFRLVTGGTLPTAEQMTFAVYSSTTTGDIKPAALAVELTDPSLAASTTASYTLIPTAPLTLQANTTYWVGGFSTLTGGTFGWSFDNPDSIATSNGVTVPATSGSNPPAGWFYNVANGESVTSPSTYTGKSGITNDVVINASVPEPASLGLLLGGVSLLAARRRGRA